MVGILIRMKLRVMRHSLRGRQAVQLVIGALFGLIFAALTMLAGSVDYTNPAVSVDVLAALFAAWTVGWLIGPVIFGGSDETLRVEHFTLLPIRPRKLALGLYVIGFIGVPALVSLIAFASMVVYASGLGAAAVAVGVVFTLLQLLFVVLLSRVVVGAIGALVTSRKGRDVGILLVALIGLSGVGINYIVNSVGPALIQQRAPGLSTVIRSLPSGWGPVAIRAAADSRWGPVALLAAGMVVLLGVLLVLYSALLVRRTTRVAHSGQGSAQVGRAGGEARRGLLPATPVGAVAAKEVRTWWRDARRRVALVSTVIVGVVIAVVPAVSGLSSNGQSSTTSLPYVALIVAAFACMQAGNLYGFDGSALWQTLLTPGGERADVRGRQLAWLLIVAPVVVALAVIVPGVAGRSAAYPWVLGLAPALLGAGAGLIVLLSVFAAYPLPDQRKNTNPFASGGRPGCGRALLQLGMALLLVVAALPSAVLLLAGTLTEVDLLRWLATPVGVAVGAVLCWWWGRLAYQRLREQGPELFDLVRKER